MVEPRSRFDELKDEGNACLRKALTQDPQSYDQMEAKQSVTDAINIYA